MAGGIVTTGDIGKLLVEGLAKIYGQSYNEANKEYPSLFTTENSYKNAEDALAVTGLSLLAVKGESEAITFDSWNQSYLKRFVHTAYAKGIKFTKEAIDDNLYMGQIKTGGQLLARVELATRETVLHNVLNRAFNSSYTGSDGKALCATDHPNQSGGTFKNKLSTDADFSDAALEQAMIDIERWTDDRGIVINAKAVSLHVPTELRWEAMRVLKTVLEVGTANNTVNTMKDILPYYVHRYLTDVDAWFLKTDVPNGLIHYNRTSPTIMEDNENTTLNKQVMLYTRYSAGWADQKGLFGSQGA